MSRVMYYDILRVIAMSLVIFNHIQGFLLYQISGGALQVAYMVIAMLTKVNVPIFFMISGALLLGKEDESIDTVLRKRVVRFIEVIVLFSALAYFCVCIVSGDNFEIVTFVRGVLACELPSTYSYWFLYAYLGFLLLLPFLRGIAARLTGKGMLLIVVLHFLMLSLLPIVNAGIAAFGFNQISISTSFSIPLATEKAFFFTLLGYYIDKKIDLKSILSKQRAIGLLVASVVCVAIECLCTYSQGWMTGEFTQDYVQLFDWVLASALFVFVKYWSTYSASGSVKQWCTKVFCFVGPLTFGMYLLDPCLKSFFYSDYLLFAEPLLPTMIVSMGWVIVSMVVGGIITFCFKKIPYIGKII